MALKPPFEITPKILTLSQEIGQKLGLLKGLKIVSGPVKLRRENQIKTIQSTLAIEGNTLALDQVKSILEGKTVLGPKNDILEVKNAIDLYHKIHSFNPLSIKSFLKAHQILMTDLIDSNGAFREKGVGSFKGNVVAHVAPPPKRVPKLMSDLFDYLKDEKEISWLIKACVFHYELEFIHPFSDGNGRMGRLWQQLILMKADPVFEYITVESLIKKSQDTYYEVLEHCDEAAESTLFIEYSLNQIALALDEYLQVIGAPPENHLTRLEYAQEHFRKEWFARKEYTDLLKGISTATGSRDLLTAVKDNRLKKKGAHNKTQYQFIQLRR